jgi:hypothetical protein
MNALLSFIYGILVKIVDDIYDNNLLLNYKYLFVSLLLLLTAYIIFFTKDLYILWTIALVGLGIIGVIHPPLIDILPWKVSVGLGLVGFIYHFPRLKTFILNRNKNDIIFLACYGILCGIILLIEDRVLTEEYSKRKLIIRLLGSLLTLGILLYREKIKKFIDVSDSIYDIFIWTRMEDLGYVLCSVFVMVYYIYFNDAQSLDIKSSEE